MANRTYCLFDQHFTNSGEAEAVFVAVVRERGERPLEIGGFLVDLGCTGIKDAFYTRIEHSELEVFKTDAFSGGCREASAAWGRKLIEDAQAYAKSLGLKPHRDYKKAARVLGGVRASDCDEVFQFGKDGKPFYFQGEHSDETARRMVTHLERRLGSDGFHFMAEVSSALSDTIEEQVDHFLDEAEAGRLKKAKAGIETLIETHPEAASAHFAHGVIHVYEEDQEAALPAFDRAVELDPNLAEAWMNKASAHHSLKQPVKMIPALRKVCELMPPDDELHMKAQGQLEDLEDLFRETLGLSTDAYLEAERLFEQALACHDTQDYEQAVQIIKGNPERLPESATTLTLLGACYRNLKQWDLSRDALNKALEIAPEHETAHANLALLDKQEK